MKTYFTVSGEKKSEFVYNRKGEYLLSEDSPQKPLRRKTLRDRNSIVGKSCPSCGNLRSVTNKCECNS